MTTIQAPRTYNQTHVPRKYTGGKRRVSIYWTWSYPWELTAILRLWTIASDDDRSSSRRLASV